MTVNRSFSFEVANTDDGRWAVASCVSPHFYFEAETKEGAIHTAKRALAFYGQSHTDDGEQTRSSPTLTRVRRRETVRVDEPVAA